MTPDLSHIAQLIRPLIEGEGVELWDVAWVSEHGRWVLRVTLDREEGGVSVGDCARVSHVIEDVIDVEGNLPHAYTLEVSSPGIDRLLRTPRHFERFLGETVRIKLIDALDGMRHVRGNLVCVGEGSVVVHVDGKEISLPLDRIAKAQLEGQLKNKGVKT